jgi:hypothetical protein
LPLVASLLEAASGNTQPQQCIQLEKIMSYLNLHALPHYGFHQADNGPRPDNAEYLWSGKLAPPAVGEKIEITMNGIGEATVTGYFTEDGWLGVRFRAHNPPEWYVKQNGRDCEGHAFGVEIRAEDKAAVKLRQWRRAERAARMRLDFISLMIRTTCTRTGELADVAENVLDTYAVSGTYEQMRSMFGSGYDDAKNDHRADAMIRKFESRIYRKG